VTALSNEVLLRKKSGILNKASEGLSNLNPLGIPALLRTLLTMASASPGSSFLPACSALSVKTCFALSINSRAGLYLNHGIKDLLYINSYVDPK